VNTSVQDLPQEGSLPEGAFSTVHGRILPMFFDDFREYNHRDLAGWLKLAAF
jgi:hypothetical protein